MNTNTNQNTKTVCIQLVGYDNSDIHKKYEYINITNMHAERQNMTTLINSPVLILQAQSFIIVEIQSSHSIYVNMKALPVLNCSVCLHFCFRVDDVVITVNKRAWPSN